MTFTDWGWRDGKECKHGRSKTEEEAGRELGMTKKRELKTLRNQICANERDKKRKTF